MAKLMVIISVLIMFFFNLGEANDTSENSAGVNKELTSTSEKTDQVDPLKDFSLCDTETNKAKCCKEKYANDVKRCARTLRMKKQRGK